MKKKALLASVVALVTASAMTFAPVSYKVIDKAYAATENVEKASNKIKAVFAQLQDEDALVAAYEDLLEQADKDIAKVEAELDIAEFNISENLDPDVAEDVKDAIIAIAKQLIKDYSTKNENFNKNLGDLSTDLEAAIENLNDKLAPVLSEEITRDDVALLLEEIEEKLFEKFSNEADLDWFDEGNLSEEAKDAIKAVIEEEWNTNDNSLVAAFVDLYGGEFEKFDEDVEKFNSLFQADLTDDEKDIYAKGAAAVAIAYAKHHYSLNQPITKGTSSGRNFKLNVNFGTSKVIPLDLFKWKSEGTVTVNPGNANVDPHLDLNLSGVNLNNDVTVSAVLDKTAPGYPSVLDDFDGVTLFSYTSKYSVGGTDGGGIFVPTPELGLVSDYQAKAAAISGLVADYLEANPDLYNNTLKRALIKLLEEQLRQALTVQAANSVTVSNGVSTLNITPAQMTTIYDTQLNTVLNALKAALEEQKLDLNISPVLTYNIGATSNGEVNLNKDLIDSLTSKEIAYVGVKTGDASVEASLDQLTAASKVSIKKAASTVAGAKSDTYSIAITNTNGDITGFEKQYRVTLPVSGTGSNVTVAKLGDGTQSLIGGQYDSKTRTITFFTNVLGDFVVVENSASFNDTANITWANDKIKLLADKGLLLGKGNGKFDPHGNVTRAEFTAMLVRTLNLNATTNITFNDVSENAWYYDSIAAARAYGIINGRSASEFDPNAQISREEMASIASNALKTVLDFEAPANAEEILNGFVDAANVVAVHRANVALLANEGIVQGKGKNNYDPKGTATRAESAVIIAKLFDLR
ncbi:S-layer homology domain-containing protein [Paenibacillus septentrionalis]|uniref:S-layer homology domain-containing protein n=1 Tax=Paenibacillus septentrionalis TaxID=429342 RepID=A0ABW1V4R6_9BACL